MLSNFGGIHNLISITYILIILCNTFKAYFVLVLVIPNSGFEIYDKVTGFTLSGHKYPSFLFVFLDWAVPR